MKKKGKATPVAFILTDPEGHNRITEYKTAELSACDVLLFEEEIATSDILLLQQEVPKEVNEKAVEIACKNDTKIILNPAPAREISDEIAKKIFLVTPNEQEAEFINSERFENCIITVGDKGCIINVDTNIPAKKVVPKDSTGAGDTFNGVLAVCLAEGMDFITACKYAVHGAGISVSRDYVIDSIPYREETERSLNE